MTITIRTYLITAATIVLLLFAGIAWAQHAVANSETSELIQQVMGEKEPNLMGLVSASEQTGRGVEAAQQDCTDTASPKCYGRFQAQ